MIMTVAELNQLITTDGAEQALTARLAALELLIRAYTNNNFQVRAFRTPAEVTAQNTIECAFNIPFKIGDTLQITESGLQPDALITITAISGNIIAVAEDLFPESGITITKVAYPADIKLGIANMIKWQLDNGDKVGVASETISRHSVTYFSMDGDNSIAGFPKSLLGFLKPYMKARFGQGVRI